MKSFFIGSRQVGDGHPSFIVAEVGQAHDGSLGTAHAYIDAAAAAGVDAVKFQTHIAAAESTAAEPFRTPFSSQDATRYDYWKRMEFTEPQWAELSAHTTEQGLVFLSSPFSLAAVELLERLDVPAWKIGAGEVSNSPMLDAVAATGKPVLLSTGMSPWSEIDAAVGRLRGGARLACREEDRRAACLHETPLAVLQCTTAYPCPPGQVGLNILGELKTRYACPVGLSDHSGTIYAALAAATLGANIIEVHITLSRECFGPDVPASVTTAELAILREGVRFIESALSNPVDKDALAGGMAELRATFGKSVVAAASLPAGHRLRREDLAFKKPAGGVPAAQWERLVGRVVKHDLDSNHFFADDDFE